MSFLQKASDDGFPTLTTKGQKFLFYGGASILALIAAAPALAIAAGAAVNLATVGLAAGFAYLGYMAWPWVKFKWANMVLKMMKAEARANPIETLQNEYILRKNRFEEARTYATQLVATRGSLGEKLDAFKEKYGKDDPALRKMFDGLSALVDKLDINLNNAAEKLQEFKNSIEYQNDRYQIALSTGALAASLRQATGDDDPMQEFLHNEAIDSVRESFNTSMASINDLLRDDTVTQISHSSQSDQVIDLTPIRVDDLEPEMVAS